MLPDPNRSPAFNEELLDALLAESGLCGEPSLRRALLDYARNDGEVAGLLGTFLPSLLSSLVACAHPDRVVMSLERLGLRRGDLAGLTRALGENPRALEILVTLFSGSQFLGEILLRHPDQLDRLFAIHDLAQVKTPAELEAQADETMERLAAVAVAAGEKDLDVRLDALRRCQRLELLRIGVCDLVGLLDLPTLTGQLSSLADFVVARVLAVVSREMDLAPAGFAVLALGKLGGRELNYSSDIDLVFLAAGEAHRFEPLARRLIHALSQSTPEGFLYRVDVRLRPWGRDGPLVSSPETYLGYLETRARFGEKQALVKARPMAGALALGEDFLARARPLLWRLDPEAVTNGVRALKERIEADLRRRGRSWGEVKAGEGSIRDVEFIAQYLQLLHGRSQPELVRPNTLDALAQLYNGGRLSREDYGVLVAGYVFLRTVEHYLQLLNYRQIHSLPENEEALARLARRLRFSGPEAGSHFLTRYQQHSRAIRQVYGRHLAPGPSPEPAAGVQDPAADSPPAVLMGMPPSYAETFSPGEREHHAELARRLSPENLVEVEGLPLDDQHWQVAIVGFDFLGELSVICGLLFVYGFNILEGHVFTDEALTSRPESRPASAARRKRFARRRPKLAATRPLPSPNRIVDVFTVRGERGKEVTVETWQEFATDLETLVASMTADHSQKATRELAKRIALALGPPAAAPSQHGARLLPIDITIDNEASPQHTVLRIDAQDTVGFLYEFTNSLAMDHVDVKRMTVRSVGNRVQDTLWVTDRRGRKITSPARLGELRVASVLTKHFTHLLPHSPDPELALVHFQQFLGDLFRRPDWTRELTSLERPDVLENLARLLGVSDFLWSDFLRMQHESLFPLVRGGDALAVPKDREALRRELETALGEVAGGDWRQALNGFKDREMFRIDMRQILGHTDEFTEFSLELTELAEVLFAAIYRLVRQELEAEHGTPCFADSRPALAALCALGKFGGAELGFASDIELMIVFDGDGRTTGPKVIPTSELFNRVVNRVRQSITTRREGVFEIDLRLRPYGESGPPAVSLESFSRYFAVDGDAWPYERQALVKLRPVLGDASLQEEVLRRRDRIVFDEWTFDVAALRAMRERQTRHLVTPGTVNAKYSPGGLVDLEYLVQSLQILHGARRPALRVPNTQRAITALAEAGVLTSDVASTLEATYRFLRRIIDALRIVRGNAKDLTVPPSPSDELSYLARRLDYRKDPTRLWNDLDRHTRAVQDLSARILESTASEKE